MINISGNINRNFKGQQDNELVHTFCRKHWITIVKDVLGFFQASSVSTIRIFVQTDPEFNMDFDNGCSPTELGMGSFSNISSSQYPAYLLLGESDWLLMNNACVDCTELGGKIEKPNYWPL